MMQAAGNPLLAMLSGAPAGVPAGQATAKPSSGFAALFASVQLPQSGQDVVATQTNPLAAALKALVPVLEDLKAAVSNSEGLPADVAESIVETLDSLAELLGGWLEGKPLSVEDKETLASLLPNNLAESFAAQIERQSTEQLSPVLLLHVLQQTTLSVVSDLSAVVTSGEITSDQMQPINLGGIVSVIAKLRSIGQSQAPGQHPVAIASKLGGESSLDGLQIEVPTEGGDSLESNVRAVTQALGKQTMQDQTGQPARDFLQQIALSPAHAAGAIEIPRDMVQIVPEEIVSAVQSVSETQGNSSQVQQMARPDVPQAKFTQAVIGQLRSVNLQEGTTKVELNPRGLGNVEIEMKTNVDGSLSVVVRAESAHVLSSLKQESELLAQIIAQGGEASVDFQEFASDDQQSFDGQAGLGGGEGSGDSSDDPLSDTATQTNTIGNGQLDLMT